MCYKEEKDMALTQKKLEDLKASLDRISNNTPVLKGKDRMIELDPKNSHHKEWYEKDKFKGK
jgi:hypothetical protein